MKEKSIGYSSFPVFFQSVPNRTSQMDSHAAPGEESKVEEV
jgi:hypothetical protein